MDDQWGKWHSYIFNYNGESLILIDKEARQGFVSISRNILTLCY